jgi:hypothetical protein
LWLASNKLWKAGERQIELLAQTSDAQSRDMQDSIAVSRDSANAALMSAQVSKAAIRAVMTLNNYTGGRSLDPSGGVLGYFMTPNQCRKYPRAQCHVRHRR